MLSAGQGVEQGAGGLALLRADASAQLGLGHVMRCLTLADALAGQGVRAVFCSRDLPPPLAERLATGGHGLIALSACADQEEEAEEILDHLADAGLCPDLVVCDHYGRDARWQGVMRRTGALVLAIDDLADRPHDANLLLDPTQGRRAADYAPLLPEGARCLLGPRYALLRPEFAAARPAALARRDAAGPVRRLLISLGGSDGENVTGQLLAAMDGMAWPGADGGPEVDVVLGPAAPWRDSVARQIAGLGFSARLHHDVRDMADLMSGSDLAIGAAGSTAWERCCLGLPTLMLVLADNQAGIARALGGAGAAVDLGRAEALDAELLRRELAGLGADAPRRLAMSQAARAICDGAGAVRVVEALLAFPGGAGAEGGAPSDIGLRPAGPGDKERLFAWQCDPVTRRHARNPRPPAWDEHSAWFDRRLERGAPFYIIEQDGMAAGMVRLDPVPDPVGAGDATGAAQEVSILIAPDLHGRGLAGAALRLLRARHPAPVIRAHVAAGNRASQKLFEAAGYRRIDATNFQSLPGTSPFRQPHPKDQN